MRRYTSVVNPIEALRERWGLGDAGFTEQSQSIPTGEGPSVGVHPLPSVPRGKPAPYFRPLPGLEQRPFFDAQVPSDSGAVDYNARQRSQLDQVPRGASTAPITVYPAWESRLESMRDFLGVMRYDPGYVTLIGTPGEFELMPFTVPQGYTAFWKQFRFWFEPVPAALNSRNTFVTLLVDGLIVPDYFNLPLGPLMTDYQLCFPLPISEGRRLALRISITAAVGDVDLAVTVPLALAYGNVRPRTGEPEARDVGMRAPPPVVIQQAAPAPAPAAPAPAAPPTNDAWLRAQLFNRPEPQPRPGGFVKGWKNK